jgi:hypothetical protein
MTSKIAVAGRRCNRLVALTGLSLLVGCSSYETQWNAAAERPVQAESIEGRWEGTWSSGADGHTGGLRCVITRTGPDTYQADYRATYWKIFSFGYSMPLHVDQQEGQQVNFEGTADLGWLAGGEYHYEGRADPAEFLCEYRSKFDFGMFRMKRPEETMKSER